MKNLITLLFFGLIICQSINAQFSSSEFTLINKIKLLESNKDDVERILSDFILKNTDENLHYQDFYSNETDVQVNYASGKCSDPSEEWNVSEWQVTGISIFPKNAVSLKDLKVNLSDFRKEKVYANRSENIYHNKHTGVAFKVEDKEVNAIYIFPSLNNAYLLCDKESVINNFTNKKWFVDSKLKERIYCPNYSADVADIALSENVITNCPPSDSNQKTNCAEFSQQTKVFTNAVDPENDPLTYKYEVSVGKIIGQGANVVWDLSGVAAGVYTITASVDDGCGFCGKTKTKAITVKN